MQLDKKLNLVIPVDRGATTVYVHSMPISRLVFESYFLPISRAFTAIYAEGLGDFTGPRVAALMLKRVANDMGAWDGAEGVERGLIGEIHRLTNVLAPGDKGWHTFPYQEAIDKRYFDEDDLAEIENALVFFTCASAMHKRATVGAHLEGAAKLWGSQTSSLNPTEYAASLQTSMQAENSAMKPAASSVPS